MFFLSGNTLEIFKLSDMVTHVRWYKFKLVMILFNNWQHPIKEWMDFITGNIWDWKTIQTFSNNIKHTLRYWSRIWRLLRLSGDRQQIHRSHHYSRSLEDDVSIFEKGLFKQIQFWEMLVALVTNIQKFGDWHVCSDAPQYFHTTYKNGELDDHCIFITLTYAFRCFLKRIESCTDCTSMLTLGWFPDSFWNSEWAFWYAMQN